MRKKIFLAAVLLLACTISAHAATINRTNNDSALSFEIDGGIRIDFVGIIRDPNAKDEPAECVYTFFLATARQDTTLDVTAGAVYDSLGRKFEGPVGVSIIGNGSPSEIIGGVPTLVWIVHRVPVSYGTFPAFAKMSFSFNGQPAEIRNQKTQDWKNWKEKISGSPIFETWLESNPSPTSIYNELSKVFNGHHYKVFNDEKISWIAARDKCWAMGGHLVTITSQQEQDFIDTIYTTAYDTSAWIGLFKPGGYGSEEAFQWITEEKVTYTRWKDGAPYRDKRLERNNQWRDCAFHFTYIFKNKAKKNWWDNEENTFELRYYICEWDY